MSEIDYELPDDERFGLLDCMLECASCNKRSDDETKRLCKMYQRQLCQMIYDNIPQMVQFISLLRIIKPHFQPRNIREQMLFNEICNDFRL